MTVRTSHLHAVPTPAVLTPLQRLSHHSTRREKVFEHKLLADLGLEMLARGVDMEVLHGETDLDGYDVVLEAGSVVRHTQLKVTIDGGARSDITVNTRLAAKPSACVVWLTFSPTSRGFSAIRWFGDQPGRPIHDLGDKPARHSRGNSQGVKGVREGHRILAASQFQQLDDIGHLADKRFGMLPADPLAYMLSRFDPVFATTSPWLQEVAAGNFTAIPEDLTWADSSGLGHLLNGYRLTEMLGHDSPYNYLEAHEVLHRTTGQWHGDALTLWTILFLTARAKFMGAYEEGAEQPQFDQLVQQLRAALIELGCANA